MREILFRGKRIDGLWVEGTGITVDESETRILSDLGYSYGLTWCRVYTETIGQFTGLTDKNGKKIFEGDIIEWDELEWGSKHREVVTWDYNLFAIRKDDWGEWCEVIGNIHDNPELIGGKGNA